MGMVWQLKHMKLILFWGLFGEIYTKMAPMTAMLYRVAIKDDEILTVKLPIDCT